MSEPSSFWDDPQNFLATLSPDLPQPTSFPTADEVRREARERSSKLFEDWRLLNEILKRHEETIRKRWMKKTRGKKQEVLLKAWPDMSASHRPDFLALQRESTEQRRKGTRFRDAYWWPYINLEDLVKPKSLLLFLNARGRHLPEAFAHADFDATHLGQTSLAIRSAFLNGHTMLLHGQKTAETYGQLISWDEDDEAFDWMHTGTQFHPGWGLQVLETQQRILRFLVQCCFLILQDMFTASLTDVAVPVQPEPSFVSRGETEYPSLALITAEAPYRVPLHLDFERLRAIIAAKRSAAEDYIWGLREDPGYFAEIVGDWTEHRQEKLLDTNGKRHPVLDKPLFWDRVLANVVSDAYGALMIWNVIYQQLTSLVALKEEYANEISLGRSLPLEYNEALQKFRYLLDQASKGPIANLKMGVPASPPLRSLFVREPQIPHSNIIRVKTKSAVGKDNLLGTFSMLWDEHQLFLCGLPNVLDELDRTMHADPNQKERISPWVDRVFSDLVVIGEARRQLSLYHPSLSSTYEETTDEMKVDFARSTSGLAKLLKHLDGVSLANVGTPAEGRFHYPSDKRRTLQSTTAMRAAEHHLDLFWRKFDQHMESHHVAVQHLLSGDRQVQRTAEWVEPAKAPKKAPEEDALEPLHRPFSQPETGSKERILPARVKNKTRGTAQRPETDTTPDQPREEERQKPDEQPLLAVDKRAMKVFSTLFHNPSSQPDAPGEVPWTDFLHAMAATGFAPGKLYGSVWQFTPTILDVERSIQFHEPHPHGKIPFRTARRHGRRLNRAYGWTGDIFVLK